MRPNDSSKKMYPSIGVRQWKHKLDSRILRQHLLGLNTKPGEAQVHNNGAVEVASVFEMVQTTPCALKVRLMAEAGPAVRCNRSKSRLDGFGEKLTLERLAHDEMQTRSRGSASVFREQTYSYPMQRIIAVIGKFQCAANLFIIDGQIEPPLVRELRSGRSIGQIQNIESMRLQNSLYHAPMSSIGKKESGKTRRISGSKHV